MKHLVQMAIRNFRKSRFFTLIHVAGLAIGISAALVIYLIVQHELSYEKGLKNRDRIYRVVSEMNFTDMMIYNGGVPVPTAEALRREGTGLEWVSHFLTRHGVKVTVPQPGALAPAVFPRQENITYADEFFFRVLTYEWLAGQGADALKEPNQVVLTESRAKTYFSAMPFADMLGKVIVYDDSVRAVVAGVVRDPDWVTDLHFREFISRATVANSSLKQHHSWEQWGSINSSSQLLVLLKPGTVPANIESQLVQIREKHRQKDEEQAKDDTKHYLQPVTSIHFDDKYDAFEQRMGNRKALSGLSIVAFFLLLLGCINFINLSTAQSGRRAKEVGIRKTLGGSRKQLVWGFLVETFLLALIALLASILITPGLLNIFKDFIPPGISFASLNQPHVWFFLLFLLIAVTLLSGLYPALVLSRFRPVTAMKNQAYEGTGQTRTAWLRKTLTVTQFVIAQFLIIATLVLAKQIHFSLNKDLGYNKEAIVTFSVPWNFFAKEKDERRKVLLEKLRSIPEIRQVSLAGSSPASRRYSTSSMTFEDGKGEKETMVEKKEGDSAYFKVYGLTLLAGRYPEPSDTTREFVINETLARFLGFDQPAAAVGARINYDYPIPVVGVVRDFHVRSTREPIKPLAYSSALEESYDMHLLLASRVEDADVWTRAIQKTEAAFKSLYPEENFSYDFFDQRIAQFYDAEQKLLRLLAWATGLCIFISCLGLLGLVVFTTHTRTKEIGVRKVLGASIVQLVMLLSKDFVILVLGAFLIAAPLAAWFAHDWLQDFAYRIGLSWWIFAVAALGMLLLALTILSIRTVRAAMENPVNSLRTE